MTGSPPGASGETREAAQRVAHFVAEWKKHRGHDPEQVHGLNAGTDREAVLLASDLLTLAALAPGPDTTTVVGNPMIAMVGPGQASYALLPEPGTDKVFAIEALVEQRDVAIAEGDRLQAYLADEMVRRTGVERELAVARRELGEFKTAVERLCDEWERDYTDMPTWWGVDELRDLLLTADSEGALDDKGVSDV